MADCDDQEHADRISNLPISVIDVILQRLPLHDLVKTSALSRGWRHMWASTPRLAFHGEFFDKCKNLGYLETSAVITDLLLLHTGPIHEFSLIPPPDYPIKSECFSKWILFLSGKGVKYIVVISEEADPYRVPTHIFSCGDLTYLFLQNFKLPVPSFGGGGGFQSMVALRLYDIIFESGALESLVSACPLLANLHLSYCYGFEHVNVSAPFLNFLTIESDEVSKPICLMQAQELILLTLFADGPVDNIDTAWVSDLLKDSPKIERLSLGISYIKIFSAGINPQVQLKAIKYLVLDGLDFNEARELSFVISLLESSSNLDRLIIKGNSTVVEPQQISHGFPQQISNEFHYSNCYFNMLQNVNITIKTSFKPALSFIQFLLARSPALKILTLVGLGLNQPDDASILLSISSDLLKMVRASPSAQVKFIHDGP